ncbi:uncharacterized protein BDR25DRAFT_352627 [Lindgomyces ingoldianus]|uniref:Uncharacterized protein n=1 Tax=Lindgomyces ingoldianus TaxID=673940 RepID=A0ACB6R4E0_9PLEO|nr:uncharacterized protein BDR25DRAFT_352627 [Lindgomyces ingoldianus]KAF2473182.1 hypothetical protein BDR25DRAFT_352627 [Lindgomyces ingoldianus]
MKPSHSLALPKTITLSHDPQALFEQTPCSSLTDLGLMPFTKWSNMGSKTETGSAGEGTFTLLAYRPAPSTEPYMSRVKGWGDSIDSNNVPLGRRHQTGKPNKVSKNKSKHQLGGSRGSNESIFQHHVNRMRENRGPEFNVKGAASHPTEGQGCSKEGDYGQAEHEVERATSTQNEKDQGKSGDGHPVSNSHLLYGAGGQTRPSRYLKERPSTRYFDHGNTRYFGNGYQSYRPNLNKDHTRSRSLDRAELPARGQFDNPSSADSEYCR